ncbi:MAG: hypothetical protein KGI79_00465 [Patescibacteria group bacterium]|nr:hypothetical protein [Patescibacteria group bacterium]
MISKDDLKKKLIDCIHEGNKRGNLMSGISEYFRFITEHDKELDPEAKKMGDAGFDALGKLIDESLVKMPDGIEKRKIARLNNKVWDVKVISSELEKKTHLEHLVLKETEELFFEFSNNITDFLSDVISNSLKGPDLAILGLYCSALDELIVAFHLAQHGYGPQSLSHQRVAYEALDKIKLFEKHPEYIDRWANDTLFRKEIREKLGKESSDPVFNILSEMGSHPTMKNIQSKVFMTKSSDEEKKNARIWVGGSPRVDSLVFANTGVIQVLIMLLASVASVYSKHLLPDEVVNRLNDSFRKYQAYMLKNFVEWMEKQGMDVSKGREFITNAELPKK